MNVQQQIDRLITQRAAEWFETLKNARTEEYPQFVRWIGESPRHMAEFMAVLAMHRALPGAFARAGIDREALLKRISSNVSPLTQAGEAASGRSRVRRLSWGKVAAAAAVVAAVGVASWLGLDPAGQEYSTAIGEQRTVTLADSSVIYLNAQSKARVEFGSGSRDIKLVQGEALFQVARDPQRPFRVHTRDAVVRALGTRFNVDARQTRTVVSVLEGKVEVSTGLASGAGARQPLSAGEAAEVSREGKLQHHVAANVDGAAAWRQRQLVFAKTSLEDVAADFNRFHRTGRMILEDIKPGSHHYTGTFDADDVASFAILLSRENDLTVEERDGDYIIRRR